MIGYIAILDSKISKRKQEQKTRIKCPGCGFVYEVDKVLYKLIPCQEHGCGAWYLQAVHNVNRPEWVRQALYRCRG